MSKSTSRINKSVEERYFRPETPNSLIESSIPSFHPTPFYNEEMMKHNPKWKNKEKVLCELKKLDVPKIVVEQL